MSRTLEPSNGARWTGTPMPPTNMRLASGSATTPKIGPVASHNAMFTAKPERLFRNDSVPSRGSTNQNRVHDFRSSYAGAAASSLKMGMPNGLRMSWMTCWDARSALLTNEPSAFSAMSKSWSLLGNARRSTRAAAPAARMRRLVVLGCGLGRGHVHLGKVRYICSDAGVPKG